MTVKPPSWRRIRMIGSLVAILAAIAAITVILAGGGWVALVASDHPAGPSHLALLGLLGFVAVLGSGNLFSILLDDLRRSRHDERKFRTLLEYTPDATLIIDDEGRIGLANAQAERLFGYPRSELIGQSVERLMPTRFREIYRLHRQVYAAAPTVRPMSGLDLVAQDRDGREFPVEISLSPIDGDEGHSIAASIRDVSEREAHERAIQEARERAELASEAKTDFLRNMSHELRTPLNAVIGFSELMQAELLGPLGAPKYREYIDDINQSASHLLGIVESLLHAAKLEAQLDGVIDDEVDVEALAVECLGEIGDQARAAEISLVPMVPDDLPLLRADRKKLRRALLNLLGNAVKFTGPGGRVTLGADLDSEGWLEVTVADTGIGIPTDRLEAVMEPFVQAGTGLTREHEGAGLGLPIARGLVALHGGTLDISSVPGRGTVVIIRLPGSRILKSADAA